MAQWSGQYSGNTHATRVADLEDALRHAIAAMKAAAGTDAEKAKVLAAQRLAKRVLAARLRELQARLDAASPLTAEQSATEFGMNGLRLREKNIRKMGVVGVLYEFGFPTA